MGTNLALASIKSTGSSTTRTFGDRFAEMINAKDYGCVGDGSADDTTALQSAVNAAIAAGKPLWLPKGVYKYTPPLTINGNLSIIGAGAFENWNNGINVPLGTPPITGAVLNPASNGSDAIAISGTSLCVHIRDIGILFQTPFVGTGHGISYLPSAGTQGLSGSEWNNIKVYGHDGNHYAYPLNNPLLCTFINCWGYGGGGFKIYGFTPGDYGNCVFIHPYFQVIVGGTANGFDLRADTGPHYLNLMTFIRPQAITDNIPGTSPSGNGPTSAQYVWFEDINVAGIRKIGCDFESNVSSGVMLNAGQALQNDFDFAGLNLGNLGFIRNTGWTTLGIFYGPNTRAVTDTTGSGTVAVQAQFAFPGHTVNADNTVVYTDLCTAYFGAPSPGANATAPTRNSVYGAGAIKSLGSLGAAQGIFVTGGVCSFNNNSSFNFQACIGTSSGAVQIGGANSPATTLGSTAVNITNGVTYGSFTVATLPAGVTGKTVFCSNVRVFNGAGTQEGSGSGTGGLVTYNGTAWKIEGTNITAIA